MIYIHICLLLNIRFQRYGKNNCFCSFQVVNGKKKNNVSSSLCSKHPLVWKNRPKTWPAFHRPHRQPRKIVLKKRVGKSIFWTYHP